MSTPYSKTVNDDDDDTSKSNILCSTGACNRCSPLCRKVCCVVVTLLLFTLGMVLVAGESAIANLAMQSQIVLSNWKTQIFQTWQDEANMHIDVYRHYYFYNVTNAYDVYWDRVKPDLNMMGPYTYKTRRYRPLPYMFWDVDDNVNFRYHDVQQFVPEMSVDNMGRQLTVDDNFTTINMALFTAAYRVGKIPEFRSKLTNGSYVDKQDICLLLDIERLVLKEHRAVGPKGIFTTRTIHEWLFGFKDDTLEMLNMGSSIIDYYVPTHFHLQFNDTMPAPGPISFRHGQVCPLADDESWCNTSLLSDSTIASGRTWNSDGTTSYDLTNVGQMRRWADNERLWWFGGGGELNETSSSKSSSAGNKKDNFADDADADCQRLFGTEGLFVGPNIDKSSKPSIFVDAIYRGVELAFLHDSSVEGIDTLRFGVASHETDVSSRNRRCFHQYYKGSMINLSNVAFAPGWVTAKFFYPMEAEQDILFPAFPPQDAAKPKKLLNFTMRSPPNSDNKVEMRDIVSLPNMTADNLGSHIDVHPLTGSVLGARSLMQVNAMLGPIIIDGCKLSFSDMLPQERLVNAADPNSKTYTSYFPETGLPVLLVDRSAEAPSGVVKFLKDSVIAPLQAVKIVGWISLSVSIALAIGLAVYYLCARRVLLQRRRKAMQAAASGVVSQHGGGVSNGSDADISKSPLRTQEEL